MLDYSYALMEALLSRYPFSPSNPTEREAEQRLHKARARAKSFPPECLHALFELTDSLDILGYSQAHHAFLLGLDLGLSIWQEL